MTYHRPESLAEALAIKAQPHVRILAGGTDVYPSLRDQPMNFPVLDVTALKEFRHIRKEGEWWSLGANTTWTDIIGARLPKAFDALKLAAREVGSIQIQNRATIAGNLCNASPAADGVPPLLVLDAEVEIASIRGIRRQSLASFILGNRRTALAAGELVTRILVHESNAMGGAHFVKLGARKYLVISIAMVAAHVVMKRGRIESAAIAVGACAETAKRLPAVEHLLHGKTRAQIGSLQIAKADLAPLQPIDDVRAPARYRLAAVPELVRTCVLSAIGRSA